MIEWNLTNTSANIGERLVTTITQTGSAFSGAELAGQIIDANANFGNSLPTVANFKVFVAFAPGGLTYDLSQDVPTNNIVLELKSLSANQVALVAKCLIPNRQIYINYRNNCGAQTTVTAGDPNTLNAGGTLLVGSPKYQPVATYADYPVENVGSTERPFYFVGALAPDNDGNYQKLQIDVLGGGWGNNNQGLTTYYVGNRGGLTMRQVTQGSAASSFAIKAYANPNGNTDIYIAVTQDYPAFSIKSYKLPSFNGQSQPVVKQTPVGTDITPSVVPVMITDANGNIGLNTYNTKGNKLAVNGNVIATEVTVQPYGSWPDYVFKKDYQLRSLSEVKNYIDQNQHLPEIPSAQEIEKDGLKLGDINKLLTKKVEELTLYLIEKDDQLKKQLNKQQKQINKLIMAIKQPNKSIYE